MRQTHSFVDAMPKSRQSMWSAQLIAALRSDHLGLSGILDANGICSLSRTEACASFLA